MEGNANESLRLAATTMHFGEEKSRRIFLGNGEKIEKKKHWLKDGRIMFVPWPKNMQKSCIFSQNYKNMKFKPLIWS